MMGMIYRRKKRDPATGKLEEQGPYWMKYYIEGRAIQESTKVFEKEQAKKILKVKEGEVAAGIYRGPSMDRIRFEDLAALVQQDYQINRRKTVRRITEYQKHLEPYFRKTRVSSMTTERIKAYIIKRQEQGAANGTINREIGFLKRMFRLGYQQTPQLVARVPHIPQLKEHNIRSGFFEHEDFLAL
ncbi:MAG: hypothetical protein WBO94_11290, partial [Nitrospira sp.]